MNGVYKVFRVYHAESEPEEHLLGRFWVNSGHFYILEDYHDFFTGILPEGPISDVHKKFIARMNASPYFDLIHEDQINEGHREDLIEDLDIGPHEADYEYLLMPTDGSEPKHLEVHGATYFLEHKRLSDDEAKDLISQVNSGTMKMLPI